MLKIFVIKRISVTVKIFKYYYPLTTATHDCRHSVSRKVAKRGRRKNFSCRMKARNNQGLRILLPTAYSPLTTAHLQPPKKRRNPPGFPPFSFPGILLSHHCISCHRASRNVRCDMKRLPVCGSIWNIECVVLNC